MEIRINLLFIIVLSLSTLVSHATTRTINVSQLTGNLVAALRTQVEGLNYTDKVILNFDKAGTYQMNGSVDFPCSVDIKGQGASKTIVEFGIGEDHEGFQWMQGDTFFQMSGTAQNPIQVNIHDISFRLKPHRGLWWVLEKDNPLEKSQEKLAVKIIHANKVNIERVNSIMQNAMITNFDLRVCSNITIKDCEITNFNNCLTGGNLWIRGEVRNVHIAFNKFYKYGNDEMIAFFGKDIDAYTHETRSLCPKENIVIENNYLCYGGYNEPDKNEDFFCHVLLAFFTNENETNATCNYRNFSFKDNKIDILEPMRINFKLSFNDGDCYSNMRVTGNMIHNKCSRIEPKRYMQDFDIVGPLQAGEPVIIARNSTINDYPVIAPWGGTAYFHLFVDGAQVLYQDNVLNDNTSSYGDIKTGCRFLWASKRGGMLSLKKNELKGLYMLASLASGDGIGPITLNATSNTFAGDTRIYCDNVEKLDLNFTGNMFCSSNSNFFLQEAAQENTLVFWGNTVIAPQGSLLMQHWTNVPIQSMKFNHLEVIGNIFHGVEAQSLLDNIYCEGSQEVKSNTFLP